MDTFALARALTGAPALPASTSRLDIEKEVVVSLVPEDGGPVYGLCFEITSYGRHMKFVLTQSHLTVKYIEEGSTRRPIYELSEWWYDHFDMNVDNRLILTICWILVRDNHRWAYDIVKREFPRIDLYHEDLLRELMSKTRWDARLHSLFRTICARLNTYSFEFPCKSVIPPYHSYMKTVTLSEDGRRLWHSNHTDDEPVAKFEWPCAVYFWHHLMKIYPPKESDGGTNPSA